MAKIACFDNYLVSKDGRIKSLISGKTLKHRTVGSGYKGVTLFKDGKRFYRLVHRLVAEAYMPNGLSKEQVNHLDGDKANNDVYNLEWATRSENERHSIDVLGKKPSVESELIILDKTTGKEVNRYVSVAEACRANGWNKRNIYRQANGDRKTAYGYRFVIDRYYD